MWLYVREIYNHGRRLCWAVRELELHVEHPIREYEGLAVWEDVEHINESFDTQIVPGLEQLRDIYNGNQEREPQLPDRQNRWEDFGWGGITRAFLRELGATDHEITTVAIYNPGLAPRTSDTEEEPDFDLGLLHDLLE